VLLMTRAEDQAIAARDHLIKLKAKF